MECQFCKKIVSTLYILKTHQNTVKSCLKIQKEEHGIDHDTKFECEHCKKCLTTKSSLTSHYKICKIKKENTKKTKTKTKQDLVKEINELKEKLKTPPKAQKITNHITKNKIENNIGTNIEQQNITIYQIMSPEHVEDFFKKQRRRKAQTPLNHWRDIFFVLLSVPIFVRVCVCNVCMHMHV